MENKTCGNCKSFPGMGYYCPIIGRFCDPNNEKPCEFFEKPMGRVATNGDRIIAGGMRELAKAMVYGYRETDYDGQVMDEMLYTWHLPNAKVFTEYNGAVDFLENWLNASAESKESEGEDE